MKFAEFMKEASDFQKFKMAHDRVRINVHPGQSGPIDDLKGDTAHFQPTHRHREFPDFWVMITNNPQKDKFVRFAGKQITTGRQMTGGEPSMEDFLKRFEPLPQQYHGHLN